MKNILNPSVRNFKTIDDNDGASYLCLLHCYPSCSSSRLAVFTSLNILSRERRCSPHRHKRNIANGMQRRLLFSPHISFRMLINFNISFFLTFSNVGHVSGRAQPRVITTMGALDVQRRPKVLKSDMVYPKWLVRAISPHKSPESWDKPRKD